MREIRTQPATSDDTIAALSGGTHHNYGTFQDLRKNMPMIPRWGGPNARKNVAYNVLYQTWAGVRGGIAGSAGVVCNYDSDGNLLYAMADNVMLSVMVTNLDASNIPYVFKKDDTEYMSLKFIIGTPSISSIYPADTFLNFLYRPVSGKTYMEVRVIMEGNAKIVGFSQGTWTGNLDGSESSFDNYYNGESAQNYMYWHGYPDSDPTAQQTKCL